jgi:mannose-binding lectin 1
VAIYQVWFHQGMAEKPEYELCTRVEDVHLPKTGVFGISAATGGLAGQYCIVIYFCSFNYLFDYLY